MPYVGMSNPDLTGDTQKDVLLLYDYMVAMRRNYEYLLSHLNQDNIQYVQAENGDTLFTRGGLNNAFGKWFKNMTLNSNFELYDDVTLEPTHWSGGVVTDTSNFYGTYSLKLEPGQTCVQDTVELANPSWYSDISDTTRVSFYKKGGATRVYVLDRDTGLPYNVTDKDGNTGTYIEFEANTNWSPEMYTITCVPTGATRIKVKFENSDATNNAYIDAVIIEPDYNGEYPSLYTDGPHSLGNAKGDDITLLQTIYVQANTPTDAIEKDVWIDTDDYSRYDVTNITGATTLLVSDNEYVTCSGTFNLTLHVGTSAGIIKWINNIGTGVITIIGTIDGNANMLLYPSESVVLITDGTNWRT